MIVLRRVAGGIRDHWDVRSSEWLMLYPAVGIGIALLAQPNMFASSPSFDTIARFNSDEGMWATLVLLCALLRLVALTVNGTFKSFPYSPHMRMAASLAGILFWSQWALGFVNSWLFDGGALTAVFAYSAFCLAELLNWSRSWADIGNKRRNP